MVPGLKSSQRLQGKRAGVQGPARGVFSWESPSCTPASTGELFEEDATVIPWDEGEVAAGFLGFIWAVTARPGARLCPHFRNLSLNPAACRVYSTPGGHRAAPAAVSGEGRRLSPWALGTVEAPGAGGLPQAGVSGVRRGQRGPTPTQVV